MRKDKFITVQCKVICAKRIMEMDRTRVRFLSRLTDIENSRESNKKKLQAIKKLTKRCIRSVKRDLLARETQIKKLGKELKKYSV